MLHVENLASISIYRLTALLFLYWNADTRHLSNQPCQSSQPPANSHSASTGLLIKAIFPTSKVTYMQRSRILATMYKIVALCLALHSVYSLNGAESPPSFDWRTHGAVGPVRNQGQMGSSTALATIGSMESLHAIQTGSRVRLSIQEVADCCQPRLDCRECIAGKLHGLCSEADYPSSTKAGQCHSSSCNPAVTISGFHDVLAGNETALEQAVLQNPVIAVIDASHSSFQLYRGGVYRESMCSTTQLDHAVLVVGYGSMNSEDYWICQNSWGTGWGMKGYVLIARNAGNMCGIAADASYPMI